MIQASPTRYSAPVVTVVAALIRMSRPAQLSMIVLVYGLGALLALAQSALASAESILLGFTALLVLVVLLVGVVAGVTLSPMALALLAAILLLGWGYSVGPAFAWNGLGEVDNALVGGILLPLYGVAATGGTISLTAVLAVLPFSVMLFCNLLATHWPDREADAAVGKETLATQWPRQRLKAAYGAAFALYLVLVALFWGGPLPLPVAVASAMVIPHFLWAFKEYTVRNSPAPTVGAMLSLAALQTIGWAIAV